MKRVLVFQNFSRGMRIEYISFNLSSFEKACLIDSNVFV